MTMHHTYTLSNTSATKLTPNGLHSGMDITIQNVDASAYVYVGGEGVTTNNYGFRIAPNNALAFELPPRDSIFVITDTNGSKVAVLKTGLEG